MERKLLVICNLLYFLCFDGKNLVLFLMQNVEDNDYVLDDEPSLDFISTIEDLGGVSTTMTKCWFLTMIKDFINRILIKFAM